MKAQEKKYDLAVSFNMPYYYVLDKVTATKKVGLIHTDYSTVHIGTKAIINMFERIDQIQCVSQEVRETDKFVTRRRKEGRCVEIFYP